MGNSVEAKALVSVIAVKINESRVMVGEEFSMVALASLSRQTQTPESEVLVKALAAKLKPEVKANLEDLKSRAGGLGESWLIGSDEGKELVAAAAHNNAKKHISQDRHSSAEA